MLSLEEIQEKTLWVARMTYGERYTGTYKEIKQYENNEDCKDVDILTWKGQPKELQEFYKDYEYATYHLGRHDLYVIQDFYEEWSKNPNQFKPEMRSIKDILTNVLNNNEFKNYKNWCITNYDGKTIGNHYRENYVKAIHELDCEFEVVEITTEKDTINIIIQSTDEDLVDNFSNIANKYALVCIHD